MSSTSHPSCGMLDLTTGVRALLIYRVENALKCWPYNKMAKSYYSGGLPRRLRGFEFRVMVA